MAKASKLTLLKRTWSKDIRLKRYHNAQNVRIADNLESQDLTIDRPAVGFETADSENQASLKE